MTEAESGCKGVIGQSLLAWVDREQANMSAYGGGVAGAMQCLSNKARGVFLVATSITALDPTGSSAPA